MSFGACWDCHLGVPLVEIIRLCSVVVWSRPLYVCWFGAPWEASLCGQGQPLPMTSPEATWKFLHSDLFLEAAYAGHGDVWESTMPREAQQKTQGTQRPATVRWLPVWLRCWRASSGMWSGWGGVSGRTRVGWVVFTRLVKIQIWYHCWSWNHSKCSEHTETSCYPTGAPWTIVNCSSIFVTLSNINCLPATNHQKCLWQCMSFGIQLFLLWDSDAEWA